MEHLRIVLMGRDFELRVVSLIVRSLEIAEEVVLLDLGSEDDTVELAKKVDCKVISYDGEVDAPSLAKVCLESEGEFDKVLLVNVTGQLKLRDLPLMSNRAREKWDVHLAFSTGEDDSSNPQEVVYGSGQVAHLAASRSGLEALSIAKSDQTPLELDSDLRVRVLHSRPTPKVQQRESLATASRFAQLFYWMLESKHPLLLFGIPGIILFIVGYKLSGNVLDTFSEWNETTAAAGLAVVAVTLMGLFAMMVGLILYIMGKQVKQIQAQYDDWPNQFSR